MLLASVGPWREGVVRKSLRAAASDKSTASRSNWQRGCSPASSCSFSAMRAGKSASTHSNSGGNASRYGLVSNPAAKFSTRSDPSFQKGGNVLVNHLRGLRARFTSAFAWKAFGLVPTRSAPSRWTRASLREIRARARAGTIACGPEVEEAFGCPCRSDAQYCDRAGEGGGGAGGEASVGGAGGNTTGGAPPK